ncbi:glycosyltransferase family 4 protein [Nostoc sp. CHAB 5844]|nr:glycosyltransferase family 4 protein [Nostoc sp. CHAB 5844]
MNKIKIVMLGDSLEHHGGIVTVEKLILQNISTKVQIQHIATREDGSAIHKISVFAKGLFALLLRMLSQKTDVVHIHMADWGSVFRKAVITIIGLVFRKPVLIHAHGPEFHLTYNSLPRWIQKGLSWIFRRCQGFIVLSNSWKDFYVPNLGLEPERVFVLPNPVSVPDKISDRQDNSKVKLVFSGRVGQRKGAFDLIKAFANLPTEQQDRAELVFAGDGDIEQGLDLVKNLNLVSHVTFLGWLSTDKKDELLANSHIFVLPSYNEALPMALLEAMAWGLPVITSPVGGIPEIVTAHQNGLLVTPGDIQQLTEAMQSLIKNHNLRETLGHNARSSILGFDVKVYCDNLLNIYQSISNN